MTSEIEELKAIVTKMQADVAEIKAGMIRRGIIDEPRDEATGGIGIMTAEGKLPDVRGEIESMVAESERNRK